MKNQIALWSLVAIFSTCALTVHASELCETTGSVATHTFGQSQEDVERAILQSLAACESTINTRDFNLYRAIAGRCYSIRPNDIMTKDGAEKTSKLLDLSRLICKFQALNYVLSLNPSYDTELKFHSNK